MKAVVAAFNQEKALEGAFSEIIQLHRLIVYSTSSVQSHPGNKVKLASQGQGPAPPGALFLSPYLQE